MDLEDLFGTDQKKEEEGVWVPLGGDAEVLVCRLRNKNWRVGLKRLPKTIQKQIADGTIGDEKYEKLIAMLMSKYILRGWKNLSINGQPVEYDEETALKLLEQYKDFKDRIFEIASDMEHFKKKEDEQLGEDWQGL